MIGMMHHAGVKFKPNTFIGGVGFTSVTSKNDLVALTNLNAYNINNFQIDAQTLL